MRRATPKRITPPDPIHGNAALGKFINYVMRAGKKSVAQKIVYDSFARIQETAKRDPLEVFDAAVKNVGPEVEVKSRRVGGANYQIPMPVSPNRRQSLAFRWLITAAKMRKGKPMAERLALEFVDAANKAGNAFKKREDTYRMAEANRAFAHFGRFRR